MELRAQVWLKENPHRRWFLDYYHIPPSDPRYLSLTDEEIAHDFYTVQGKREAAMEEAYETPVHESPVFKSIDAARISDTVPIAPGQVKRTVFESDEADYKRWFEENIGPWPF